MSFTPGGPNNIEMRGQIRQERYVAAAEKHRLVEEARLGDAEYDDSVAKPSFIQRLKQRLRGR